jgi:hypothetical protein
MHNTIYRRTRISLIKLTALLGAVGAVGIWFWLSQRVSTPGWVAPAILGSAAVLGILWQLRARAARRWQAALDTYAEREIIRTKHRNDVATQFKAMSGTVRKVYSRRKLHACSQSQDR